MAGESGFNIAVVKEELLSMNPVNFAKMAHGDPAGLMEMAFDYFNETRRLMTGWVALIESGNFARLRDELHRCKGGASLFGLERLVSLLGDCESPAVLEKRGFDLATFENELSAAESAVTGMAEAVC
jgi:HPt (histidine-containing phosphotransfer) domain-containing protein